MSILPCGTSRSPALVLGNSVSIKPPMMYIL